MVIERIGKYNWYTKFGANSEYDCLIQKLKDLKLYSRLNQIKKCKDHFVLKIKLDINNELAYWGRYLECEFKNQNIIETNLVEHEKPSPKEWTNAVWATRFFLYEELENSDYEYIDIIVLEG